MPDNAPLPLISSALADTEGGWEEGGKGRNEDNSSPPLLAELSRDDDLDAPLLDCRPSTATEHSHYSHSVSVIIPHCRLQPTNMKTLKTLPSP